MATTTMNTTGGLPRFDDEHYEAEFSTPTTPIIGTPRPGMDAEDAAQRQDAANQAIWSFSEVAKRSAAASKRRRSVNSRTYYRMAASKQVILAFGALQTEIQKNPEVMSQEDFNLLKQAIGNRRIRLIVHDSKTFDELKQLQEQTKIELQEAERATYMEFTNKSGSDEAYISAKDRHRDLMFWNTELAKEIRRIQPKFKYSSMGGGLFRHELNQPADPPGVASQNAQIAPAHGIILRNILKPETIRRTFISLDTLTQNIRNDVVDFLRDEARHKDRHEVIRQIKESCIAAAKLKNKNSH
jgi:hypothetical protein